MWGEILGRKEPLNINMEEYYASLGLNSISADITVQHDAASYYYGNKFRMPSADEFNELISQTTRIIEGNCIKLTSNLNGESILLPISGIMRDNDFSYSDTVRAWAKTYYDETYAYDLHTISGSDRLFVGHTIPRYRCLPVRPVYNR